MPTQTDIGHDYKRLKVLLEATDNSVITFVLYRDAKEQRENAVKLKNLINLPVTEVALKGDNLNPVRTFLDLPKEPRQAIFYTFLGSSLPEGKSDFDKFAGYVNIQREAFEDAPHAVVLWLREEQLVRLMRRAPDFWAWRSGVFDVRGELEPGAPTYRALEVADAFERGDLEEQVALYREILKGQLERDEPDLAYVARTKLRLANSLSKLGLYEETASGAKGALELSLELGHDELRSQALNFLALAYNDLGRYDEAELLFREVVKIDAEVLGKDHPNYALGLNNLAGLLSSTGRHDEAEPLLRKALEIAAKTVGKEHQNYTSGLDNLAGLLRRTGRYDEAELFYREALKIDEKVFGIDHPNYALGLNNLAALLKNMGRYDEAEPLYREMLEIAAKTLGKEHPNYALGLNNLAELLKNTGRYDEAGPLFRGALSIVMDKLGENHINTRLVVENYHSLLQEVEQQKTPTS